MVDVQTKQVTAVVSRKGIVSVQWSPKETYLVTCEKIKTNQTFKNLNVWNVSSLASKTDEPEKSFEWANSAKDGASSIKFDPEEQFCARQIAKNVIEIFENGNFNESKM